MSTIQQIYCTHCTHGSSALERREGELASRMLGYSARAGSLSAHDLRRCYRQIERHIYYYLPRDTPAEEKLHLTAASAPRRLIYFPSTSGWQLIAQICYRQVDTEGRPGSYFAHLLVRDEKDAEPRWSQLDCLKLWRAPGWVEEDSADIPFLLPPLASLDEMLGGRRPAIDDGVLMSFLKTPPDGEFDDPGGVIPQRWRQKEPQERVAVFGEAFRGLLELFQEEGRRRESLLLVVESSVAALWFYAMVRLLPPGGIRDPISFSTFEPNADRLGSTLAAVEFFDPTKTDLRSDSYRGRHFALNTFSDRRSEPRRSAPHQEAIYASSMLRLLVDEGFEAVDWRLSDLLSVEARGCEDLDQLAAVDRLAEMLLDGRPGQKVSLPQWPSSTAAIAYLRRVLVRKLSRLADVPSRLRALVGTPAHLPVLELLAAEPPHKALGVQSAVDYLLGALPSEKIAELIKMEAIPDEWKIDVLARCVAAEANLPPGCDHLWNAPPPPLLLVQLLGRLDPATLQALYTNVAGQHGAALVAAVLLACRDKQGDWAPLEQIVRAMDEAAVVSLYVSLGPAFFEDYPQAEPAMAARLHQVLHALPTHAQLFARRLDLVLAGRQLLDDRDRRIATAWASCRRAILRIGELEEQKSRLLRKRPIARIEAATEQMAEAIAKALPPDSFQDDRAGAGKQSCLRQIGRRLLGAKPLLPAGNGENRALWQKVAWYFEQGRWSQTPLRRLQPKAGPRRVVWLALAAGVAVVSLVIAAIALLSRTPETDPAAPPPRPAAPDRPPPSLLSQSPTPNHPQTCDPWRSFS